jgi:hypothetical protein
MPEFTVTEAESPYGAKVNRERLVQRAQPIAGPQAGLAGGQEIDGEVIDLPPVPEEVMAESAKEKYAPAGYQENVPRDTSNLPPDVDRSLQSMTRWSVLAMRNTSSYETRQIARLAQEIHEARSNGSIPFQYLDDEDFEDYDGEEGVGR